MTDCGCWNARPTLRNASVCTKHEDVGSPLLTDAIAGDRHGDAVKAALEAGFTRFRPVLMTALAMIIGMIPMALGLGDGGEENAPLRRAVIGGLMLATVATLIFVPTVFALIHGMRRRPVAAGSDASPRPPSQLQ